MCPYKSRIQKIFTDGLPYTGAKLIGVGIGSYNRLVVAQYLIAYIPLVNFSLPVFHDTGDMVLHDVEQLRAAEVVGVLLAICREP